MSGLIGALNTGKSGLMVNQKGIEVTGENVTNANTAGYSRQTLEVSSAPSLEFNGNMVGRGAVATGVARAESIFVTNQLIAKSADYGEQNAMTEPLEELERIVSIDDDNLAADIDDFFVAWQALSNDPSSSIERQEVMQKGDNIADTFNKINDEMNQLKENINLSIESEVEALNQKISQVADLNIRIVSNEADGSSANGLRDERDLLLQEISETIGVTSYENENGMVSVQLGSGLPLVEGSTASTITSERVSGLTTLTLDMGGSETVLDIDDAGGEIMGLMTVRDETIDQAQADIDKLAYSFATAVNAVHEGGVDADGNTGTSFFSYTSSSDPMAELWDGAASSISMALNKTSEVAAGTIMPPDNTSGDNTNILSMVALQDADSTDGSTFNEFYSLVAADVGLSVEQNIFELGTTEDALVQIQNMRDTAVGVSSDEELLLLLQYQSGYEAAAKYISVIEEMLNTMLAIGG